MMTREMRNNELQVVQEKGYSTFSQKAIDEVIDIVEQATTSPLPSQSEEVAGAGKVIVWIRRNQRKMLLLGIGLLVLLGALALLKDQIPRDLLIPLALLVAALAEMTGCLMLLSEIVVELPFLNQLRKRPYSAFIKSLRTSTTFDLVYLKKLEACDPKAVQYVLRHYQYHRTGLEKRGAALSGNIDKIGLFPAVAAVILLWQGLSISPFGRWLVMLVPVIFVFHLLNLWSFGLQQRMDRIIALLEVSVGMRRK